MTEILWHGRGGQGAFTAARLLGAAFAELKADGKILLNTKRHIDDDRVITLDVDKIAAEILKVPITNEVVDVPTAEQADAFLAKYETENKLDLENLRILLFPQVPTTTRRLNSMSTLDF